MKENSNAMNGKMNQFMYGSGIIAGYYVVGIDDNTISVEPGMALDDMGYTLSMEKPYVKKLEFMEGYADCMAAMKKQTAYVCLEHSDREENSCRIFLTAKEPGEALEKAEDWYEQKCTVYEKDGIAIRHILPKYVKVGTTAKLRVEIEVGEQVNQPVSLTYEAELKSFTCEKRNTIRVRFQTEEKCAPGVYWCAYDLQADKAEACGSVSVKEEDFILELEGMAQLEKGSCKNEIYLVENDIKDMIAKDYYSKSVKELFHDESKCPLYLAAIVLDIKGESYKIKEIANAPFGQYAVNPMLEKVMEAAEASTEAAPSKPEGTNLKKPEEKKVFPAVRITQGSCIIPLAAKTAKGQRYYSAEIVHGLGAGKVMLTLGLEKNKDNLVYGDASIFDDKEPVAEVAANLNPEKGSFIVGIRLGRKTNQEQIVVHWTAIKDNCEQIFTAEQKKLQIQPGVINLKVRERYQLNVLSENMLEQEIEWIVKDEQGGEIDEHAVYTAPNTPGVYEIVAQSNYMPEVRSVAYVVVRDRD